MIYKELKLEPGDGVWCDSVRLSRLECFLPNKVINSLKYVFDITPDYGIWDDKKEKVKAATLEEVFPLIIEQGYRYVNTYWVGGSSNSAYKVLTFIK